MQVASEYCSPRKLLGLQRVRPPTTSADPKEEVISVDLVEMHMSLQEDDISIVDYDIWL